MSNGDDPLNREVSVEGKLTDNSLTVKTKSRLVSAVDRFSGNVVDWINMPFERRNSENRSKIDAKRAVMVAAKNAAVQKIETDPQFAERAIESELQGVLRKQENKDAVVQIAYDELKRLPPPETESEAADRLDEDFLNVFERYAETASSDRMRNLFGRILSGEIRKPGAFSFSTLRLAAELDQHTAQIFQRIVSQRVLGWIPTRDDRDRFADFLDLEAAGLVNHGGGG
jgi:hypothetical protein